MCGIAGYFSANPKSIGICDVEAMISHLSDRGPNYQDVWRENGVVLAHSRLSIIDLNARSNQPMVGSRFAISFNGEIFNFRQLRDELRQAGVDFQTEGDTEVILRGIEKWGVVETVERLAGMFAIAIFDRSNRELHLVRDRLGIKPLFFCEDTFEGVSFGSNPAAIIKGQSENKWQLDRNALAGYFLLGATTESNSLVQGIQSVDAAEIITWSPQGMVRRHRYWKPAARHCDIEELLYTVFSEHKEADVPTAVFLSGGVDSSVLSVILKDLNCFHLRSSEIDMAQHICDVTGNSLEVCEPTEDADYDMILADFARSSGTASGSAIMPYIVSRKIHEAGYKVAFSANGADELFLGYQRTPSPELNGRFRPPSEFEAPQYDSLAQQLRHIFRSPENFVIPGASSEYCSISLRDRLEKQSYLPEFPKSSSHRWLELQTYVLQDLNPTLDYTSMAHGLEVRVPFLDHRIVEAALTKNAEDHITARFGRKSILKEVLSKTGVHPSVWARPKMGFSLTQDALDSVRKKRVDAMVELREEGYLNADVKIGQVYRDFQYLSSAAHAFQQWKRVWIDTGIVKA